MKALFPVALVFACSSLLPAQTAPEKDIWSGQYEVFADTDATKSLGNLSISKSKTLKAEDVPSRLEADLERWTVSSAQDGKTDSTDARRFLYNEEDDEYKEFGWTEKHKAGQIKCLDGGHFFLCQTDANTTVEMKGEKPLFTKTGFFGVWLHYGLVTIKKVK
jgi:hypothetical protein